MTHHLRNFIALLFLGIMIYSTIVILKEGPNFMLPFLGNLASVTWQGQFNLDFASYLLLSGLWIAWREGFSGRGILLGGIAAVLGMMVFAPYLLVRLHQSDGDLSRLLLGVNQRVA